MRCYIKSCITRVLQLVIFGLLLVLLYVDVPLPEVTSRQSEMRREFQRLQVPLAPTDIQYEESLANETTPLRLARMRKVCQASPELQTSKGPIYGNLVEDILFKTVACLPAKAKSSDWKYLLIKLHMFRYARPQRDAKLHKASTLGEFNMTYLSDHPQEERDRFLKNYYKYVVVRHPWVRLVAGYQERFEEVDPVALAKDKVVKEIKEKYDPLNESGSSSVLFHEYVQYVLSAASSSPTDMDRRWMPMRYACEPCLVKYDFIVKLENLDFDLLSLFYAINVTGHKMPYHGATVKQDDPVSKIMPYFTKVSEADYLQLFQLYKSDFELFGYTLPKRQEPTKVTTAKPLNAVDYLKRFNKIKWR